MSTTTTMEPDFLLAVIRMQTFKGKLMIGAQAALLHLALRGEDFSAADLPGEVCNGSKHVAGAATGSLVSQGLLVVVGRMKSPNENAKGRRLDVLRLAPAKRSTVLTWLRANDLPVPAAGQQIAMAI